MKSSLYFVALALTGFLSSSLIAQQTVVESLDVDVVEQQQEDGQPLVISAIRTSEGDGPGEMRIMASDSFGGSLPMFLSDDGATSFQFGHSAPDEFNMLHNPSVQKDLELVEEQMDQIRAIQKEFSAGMKDHIKNLTSGKFDPTQAKDLSETIKGLKDQQREKISSVLLDHQRSRLDQIALQQHMKNAGTAGALMNARWAEALGIDDDQRERLKAKAKELKEKRAKKIAEMDAQMKKDLLGELTSEQREKLDEMTGDKYESKSEDWRERFESRIKDRVKSEKKSDRSGR